MKAKSTDRMLPRMKCFKMLVVVLKVGMMDRQWKMEGKKTKANEQWKPPPAATKMSMEPKGCID